MTALAVSTAALAEYVHDHEHTDRDALWEEMQRGPVPTVVGRTGVLTVTGVLVADQRAAWGEWCRAVAYTAVARGIAELDTKFRAGEIDRAVLHVNSPGGVVGGIDDVLAAIEGCAVPLVGYTSGGAYSAGYALLAACDRIVAAPGANTGSIGSVIFAVDNSAMLAQFGLREVTLRSGRTPNKATGPNEDGYAAQMQPVVDDKGDWFLGYVQQRRGLSGDLDAVAEATGRGAILTARYALDVGLIDEIGTFSAACAWPTDTTGAAAPRPPTMGDKEGGMADPDKGRGSTLAIADMPGGGDLLAYAGLKGTDATPVAVHNALVARDRKAAAEREALAAERDALAAFKAQVEAKAREAEVDAKLAEHGVDAKAPDRNFYRAALLSSDAAMRASAEQALAARGRPDAVAEATASIEGANQRGSLDKGTAAAMAAYAAAHPEHAAALAAFAAKAPANARLGNAAPAGGDVLPSEGSLSQHQVAEMAEAAANEARANGGDPEAAYDAKVAELMGGAR